MPFAINASTKFISPTKLLNFSRRAFPSFLPPITDVVHPYGDQEFVEIAETAGDFAICAERMLRGAEEGWLSRVDAHLATTSWDKTWARMFDLIETGHGPGRVSGGNTVVIDGGFGV